MLFSKLLLGHPDPWYHPEFLALKDSFNLVLMLNPTTHKLFDVCTILNIQYLSNPHW